MSKPFLLVSKLASSVTLIILLSSTLVGSRPVKFFGTIPVGTPKPFLEVINSLVKLTLIEVNFLVQKNKTRISMIKCLKNLELPEKGVESQATFTTLKFQEI